MFWPSMAKQIEDVMLRCAVCNTFWWSNTKGPLICHDIPDKAWEKLGVSLFYYDQGEHLLWLDYFSKFPEIAKLTQADML